MELRLRDPSLHDGLALPLAGLHQGDGLGFLRQRSVRGPVLAVTEAGGFVKMAIALHLTDGCFGSLDGDGAGIQPKRRGKQGRMGEHRLAFAEMARRPGRTHVRHEFAMGSAIAADEDILIVLHRAVICLA